MTSPGHVDSLVTDAKLIEERRAQVIRAAVKLFSEKGYYTTTIQQIAREAGVSVGLIYQYFGDKDDILYLSLKLVTETYERVIPPYLQGIPNPVERLCMALRAYCKAVDELREATVLAYRSTKSLRVDRRVLIKADETRTNRLLEDCVRACVVEGYMHEVDKYLLVYQYVMFCHSWALKHWAFRRKFDLAGYFAGGLRILVEPFLTPKGRRALSASLARIANFGPAPKAARKPGAHRRNAKP